MAVPTAKPHERLDAENEDPEVAYSLPPQRLRKAQNPKSAKKFEENTLSHGD